MIEALLLVLMLKTDHRGVSVDYKFKFPSMEACYEAVENSRITIPAAENETTLSYLCIPAQDVKYDPQ
jgi:hypothetical protein